MLTKEFKVVFRDRQSLILLFIMPTALILVISLALKDIHGKMVGGSVKMHLVDNDNSELSKDFTEELTKLNGCQLVTSEAEEHQVSILIPPSFSSQLTAQLRGEISSENTPLQFEADPTLEQVYRNLTQNLMIIALQKCIFSLQEKALGTVNNEGDTTREGAQLSPSKLIEEKASAGQRIPTPLQQTVPAWAIFSMFFISLPLANSLISERKCGFLQRVRTYPVSLTRILCAKLVPYFSITIIQFILMLSFGTFVAPLLGVPELHLGSSPGALILATLGVALTATSFGMMIANISASFEQASAIGSFSTVIMAMMGGIMIPVFIMPAFMQKLAQASPLYWALQSYHEIFLRGGMVIDILPHVGILMLFSALFIFIAAVRFRWE